jgi:8-oxo-dGTP pyrophosphatase MutT (NUDIX family)
LVRQSGAIPVRDDQVCLVSSRSGKRWVLPKGCLEPDKTAGEVALMEAWEEAGLVGVLHPEPVGSYIYEKAGTTHHVTLFLMRVTQVVDDWPERDTRSRQWVSVRQALLQIQDAGLRDLLRHVLGSKEAG